jgi:hypothetical protein
MFNNIFPQNLAVYEIIWKITVQSDRTTDGNIIQCMHFVCRIAMVKIQTHTQNVYYL